MRSLRPLPPLQTTYHSRTPQVCDEIKVQLPEQLTPRHRLLFTVFHVHVKRKTGGMFAKSGSVDEQVRRGWFGPVPWGGRLRMLLLVTRLPCLARGSTP